MKLEYIFIGVLMFGLVFSIGFSIYGEALSNYDVSAETDSTFGKMSYQLKSVYDYQNDMKDKVQGGSVTDTDAVDEMVKGGYTGIRTGPFSTLAIGANATMTFAKETSGYMHPNLISFGITVLTVMILFSIIALIFRYRSD